MYDVVVVCSWVEMVCGVVIVYCQGILVCGELEVFGFDVLIDVIEVCIDVLMVQFGVGLVDGKIQVLMFSVIV